MSSFKRFNGPRTLRLLVNTGLFSVLLLMLAIVLLFLSKHEPDPTPDKVGAVLTAPAISA